MPTLFFFDSFSVVTQHGNSISEIVFKNLFHLDCEIVCKWSDNQLSVPLFKKTENCFTTGNRKFCYVHITVFGNKRAFRLVNIVYRSLRIIKKITWMVQAVYIHFTFQSECRHHQPVGMFPSKTEMWWLMFG